MDWSDITSGVRGGLGCGRTAASGVILQDRDWVGLGQVSPEAFGDALGLDLGGGLYPLFDGGKVWAMAAVDAVHTFGFGP